MAKVKSQVRAPRTAQRKIAAPPQFGSHLSIAGGVANAITAARELNFDTVQIFVKNQRQWVGPPLKADDIAAWRSLQDTKGFGPTVAHATYLINLASADDVLHKKSCAAFADELQRCDLLGIPYLVIHPGACGEQSKESAIARVAAALNSIFAEYPMIQTMPLLETTAGQGTTLGRNFEELGQMITQLREPQRVGICIDTCHVFAAGYDIRTGDGYSVMIEAAKKAVGIERIRCWHLNDSKGTCGSRLDRHEHIGFGAIGINGFTHVVRDPRWAGVPMILETPKEDNDQGEAWDCVNLRTLLELRNHLV